MITQSQLDKINAERRRLGQAPITRFEAEKAARDAGKTDDGAFDFLIGLAGVPWPSAAGMAGFLIGGGFDSNEASAQPASVDTTPNDTFSSGGGTFDGGGSSGGFDGGGGDI